MKYSARAKEVRRMKARADNLSDAPSLPSGVKYSQHAVKKIILRILRHGISLRKVNADLRQALKHNNNSTVQEGSGRIMIMGRLGRYIMNPELSVVITFRHRPDMRRDWVMKTYSAKS